MVINTIYNIYIIKIDIFNQSNKKTGIAASVAASVLVTVFAVLSPNETEGATTYVVSEGDLLTAVANAHDGDVIMCQQKNTDMTLNVASSGSGEFYINDLGLPKYQAVLRVGSEITNFVITPSSGWGIKSVILTAGDGTVFDKTGDAVNGDLTVSYNESADGTNTITAVFVPLFCYITATSDSGSTVSPEGKITVEKKNDITFFFSALNGYHISSATADGVPLTQARIDSGQYTFYDVIMNHTIEVRSATGPVI